MNPEEPTFSGRVGFGERPAIVIVDLVRGFTEPESALACDTNAAVAASVELIMAARERDAPVIFTTVVFDAAMLATGAVWLNKVPGLKLLTPGSRWVEVDPRLGARDDDPLIVKPFASAFHGTSLSALLAVARVDTLIVTGASTSGCVRATAVDGLQNGFRTIVAREGVADRDARSHEVSLADLDGRYADVCATAEILAYLRRDTSAPAASSR